MIGSWMISSQLRTYKEGSYAYRLANAQISETELPTPIPCQNIHKQTSQETKNVRCRETIRPIAQRLESGIINIPHPNQRSQDCHIKDRLVGTLIHLGNPFRRSYYEEVVSQRHGPPDQGIGVRRG
ncbi:hypothetical protein J1614_003826 [Plenodomus biglobosus]|nr:hypothetical protein J1614_003826 [Plenodomus biglobosus]